MKRELLHRFFEGKTSLDEESQLRQWLTESEENEKYFLQERITYDALLFTPKNEKKRQKRLFAFTPWMISTAAAVALLIIAGGLYLLDTTSYQEQYNTIIVPPGQRINLVLADNSNVWLNANTTLRYPTHFSRDKRTVYLDGEAYFEVSKNRGKPFIVHTGLGEVKVTGTSFNVEAYSHFERFETSLFEGGVEIYNGEEMLASLKPNEKSVIENGIYSISTITNTDKYLWRHGLIAFNSKKLEDILLTLEKYFAVEIQVNADQLPQHTYTGKFRQSDGVDYALRVLQKSIHFRYNRDEETGIIYIK